MTGPGSARTTQNLLDGAARAAFASACLRGGPPFTRARWAYHLCGFYRTTSATPRLMRTAADRFARAGRAALADWAAEKAREERGHDALALHDLRALGYDSQAAVVAIVPSVQAALVSHFERLVYAEDPIGCVGYAYTLERTSLGVDDDYIARVEAGLPPGVRATRCLRVHSAAGSDPDHVREIIDMVSRLTAAERAAVARACHETALLCAAEEEPLDEVTLEWWFAPFER